MTATFEGKVALVTGAGRGIGRAVALQFAAQGAHVALVARSPDQLEEAAGAVRAQGGVAVVLPAVIQPVGPTLTAAPAAWAAAFAVNVHAPFHFAQAVLPSMLDRGWGRIVNVSSGIAAHPGATVGMNAYAATKAALEAHTLNLAAELAGTGVTVNVYRPGSVDTAMQAWIRSQPPDEIGSALHERFRVSYERGALITPDHSARSLLAHLVGDTTGEIWTVTDA